MRAGCAKSGSGVGTHGRSCLFAPALLAGWLGFAAAAAAATAPSQPAPAAPALRMMVVAADPLAAAAGLDILKAGGDAVDAAVAAQMVLALVEPQSSGPGGGAFLLHYDARSGAISSYDGRETAPAAARPDLLLGRDGQPLDFMAAMRGGRAVGVPGAVAMLEMVHREHGRLPWARLFAPAIRLAETGFAVSPRLAAAIAAEAPALSREAAARAYFLPDGVPPKPGSLLKNPALGATLRQIAALGSAAISHGRIAADIASAVRSDPNPGLMTTDDLAAYQPLRRAPVCARYHGAQLCGMGPPSFGGISVLETLGILSHFDISHLDPAGADADFLLIEAERLAFADRDRFGADPGFVPVPVAGLIAPTYLAIRAQLIDPDRAMATVRPGNPAWSDFSPIQPAQPEHGTSEIAVVDADGNAVSLTTTIEYEFGAHLLVDGFLLNNELTDFSFRPMLGGRPLANRVQPGKRPRSSMAPMIVLDGTGHLRAVVGSAGGQRIPAYVAQALLACLDWGLDPVRALALGHVAAVDGGAAVEAGTPAARQAEALHARGEAIATLPLISGTALILATPAGLLGAADPRRNGTARGE